MSKGLRPELGGAGAEDGDMDTHRDRGQPPRTPADQAKLNALLTLRDRLQQLHAELEYLRLMMRLRSPRSAR